MGAFTSAMSGGVGRYIGGDLPKDFGSQLVGRVVSGGVAGGIAAAAMGGDFGQGVFNGAWTSAYGAIFNDFGIITGTLLCTALSFGFAWAGTQIASWAMGNPTAASAEFSPDSDYAEHYRVSNLTSEMTFAAGALTVSAEALVMGSIAAAPAAGTLGLSYATQINQLGLNAVDFINGYLPGTPPPSWLGYLGGFTSNVIFQ